MAFPPAYLVDVEYSHKYQVIIANTCRDPLYHPTVFRLTRDERITRKHSSRAVIFASATGHTPQMHRPLALADVVQHWALRLTKHHATPVCTVLPPH